MNTKKAPNEETLKNFSKGIWTREFEKSKSIIDYLLVDDSSESIVKKMIIDDRGQFSIQSDHNWIVSVIGANYMRIKWPTVKKTKWKLEKLTKGGASKFAKAFGEFYDATNGTNLEDLNNNILDCLNRAGEKVVGKTLNGKPTKKKPTTTCT